MILCGLMLSCTAFPSSAANTAARIDRQAVVSRHNPVVREVDPEATLTVGNGGFAFGADITGLQTFPDHYHRFGVPLETQSRWCWVTDPNPQSYTLAAASREFTRADGRVVAYPTEASSPAGNWLRINPRVHPLGQFGLEWRKRDGSAFVPQDVGQPRQALDLWRGLLRSEFTLRDAPVAVSTVCHPALDLIAVRVESPLLTNGELSVRLAFLRGHDLRVKHTPPLDWTQPASHQTRLLTNGPSQATLERIVNGTRYGVQVAWTNAEFTELEPHHFRLSTKGGQMLEFRVGFQREPGAPATLPGYEETRAASATHWENFWRNSAAIDFSGSKDPRAQRLEERVVRSRYLMAAQMAGDVPPQESGLTCATWYGKHHTEMIWWHAAHFALWGNDDLLARNLAWYQRQLPAARELARTRELRGARWAKMTGIEMRESPGGNPLIVWNQPHVIALSELLYRNAPTPATLARYGELVAQTAECLASMVTWNEERAAYVLGPPLWIAQEIYDPARSQNPGFELAYWRWTLGIAQQWRERAGQPRNPQWDHILTHLPALPQKAGLYVALESQPDTFDNVASRHDHPTMLAPLGLLPGLGVDRAVMGRTLDAVLRTWDWETKIWGWDYPMIAMTAARLGRPETAVEILLRDGPNNRYLRSGHCPQRSDEASARSAKPNARRHELAAYLPANGACLAAVAMMAGGWDGAPARNAPGFPDDGQWVVRHEGLHPLP